MTCNDCDEFGCTGACGGEDPWVPSWFKQTNYDQWSHRAEVIERPAEVWTIACGACLQFGHQDSDCPKVNP